MAQRNSLRRRSIERSSRVISSPSKALSAPTAGAGSLAPLYALQRISANKALEFTLCGFDTRATPCHGDGGYAISDFAAKHAECELPTQPTGGSRSLCLSRRRGWIAVTDPPSA